MATKKNFKNVFQEATSKFITPSDQQTNEFNEKNINNNLITEISTPLEKENLDIASIEQLSNEAQIADDGKMKERLNLSFSKEDIDYMNIMMRLDNIKFVTHYLSKLIQEDKTRRAEEYGMAVKLFKN